MKLFYRYPSLYIFLLCLCLLTTHALEASAASNIFKMTEAPNGQLDVDTINTQATVEVSYTILKLKDTVAVTLRGITNRGVSIQTVTSLSPLTFKIPKAWLDENINRTVTLVYTYKVGGTGSVITSSPISISITQEGLTPTFKVLEADGETLNASNNEDAHVTVALTEMKEGDTVALTWQGSTTRTPPMQTAKQGEPVSFTIPSAWINENIDGIVRLFYEFKVAGQGTATYSQTLPLSIITATTAPFRVVEAVNSQLNNSTLHGNANVQVAFATMQANDTVAVSWKGAVTRGTPIQTVNRPGRLSFQIPRAWIEESIGRTVTLTYTYKVNGVGSVITSPPITVSIVGQTPASDFKVVESKNLSLDPDDITGQANVQVAFPTLSEGDTVGVKWNGVVTRDTPIQRAGTERPMMFTIPKAWIDENLNRELTLHFTYKVGGLGNTITSQPITLKVLRKGSGESVAASLNARYRDTAASCAGNKPAYYCNGIVIRSTENGAYDPWNPSPSATKLGGMSFSYMRLDAHVSNLYHHSGFILLPQARVSAPNLTPQYLCIYAYDAGTLVGARGAKGCALKARSLGSCTSVGVSTPTQWYNYTKTIPNRDYQCSLSTDDPVQFQTSITVRANRPANMEALWNEVMIADWGQNKGATLPIEAIFYKSGYVAEAKAFQQKLKARNGIWAPVVKLDLTKLASTPFSYASGDQAVQP